MGVKGLQYVILDGSCPGGSKIVKIEDMVREYRANSGEVCPVIVIDGAGCIRKLYGELCWVMGGQLKEYVRVIEEFIEKFRDIGIKLTFFFHRLTVPRKRQNWIQQRTQKIEKVKKIFAAICNGEIPSDRYFHLPYGMTTIFRLALKYVYNCEVFNSRNECYQEIAGYAKRKNCLAILAQNSDFIIFDTVPYLSMAHLNLSTMTTVQFDRDALASWLGLRINQLPLFASFCGNDTIPYTSLNNFKRHINGGSTDIPDWRLYLQSVAQFIRFNWQETDPDLETIATIAFGDVSKSALLKKAMLAYDINYFKSILRPSSSDIKKKITARHVNCENTPFVFNTLHSATFDTSDTLEEYQSFNKFPPAYLLYRPVRQRCYYVIQTASDNDEKVVEEWCAYDGNSMVSPDKVEPMSCPLPMGGKNLKQLWSTRSSDSTRMEAFLTCFGVAFDYDNDYVPPEYFIFCCIVNFLARNTKIEEWQIEALIAQAIILNSTDIEFLQRLRISRYNADAVHLATLFMYGVSTVFAVLGTCSYPLDVKLAMPWNFFDGKLFHRCYERAMEKNSNYTDDEAKMLDWNLFGNLKRMCLSKQALL